MVPWFYRVVGMAMYFNTVGITTRISTEMVDRLVRTLARCTVVGTARFFWVLLFFHWAGWDAVAQPLAIRHLTTADGLSHPLVTDLIQDRDGFIWIGTRDGLNRYDGAEIQVYRPRRQDSLSLASSFINDLALSPDSVLWVASHGGLQWYNPRRSTFHKIRLPAPCDGSVARVAIEPDGFMWLRTSSRILCAYDLSTSRAFTPADLPGLNGLRVSSIGIIPELGQTWVTFNSDSPSNSTSCLLNREGGCVPETRIDGSLVLAYADEGAAKLVCSTGTCFPQQNPDFLDIREAIPSPFVFLIQGNQIWVGTNQRGILAYDLRQPAGPSRRVGGIPGNNIQAIVRDRQQRVWVGHEYGVSLIGSASTAFVRTSLQEGLPDERVNKIRITRDGTLFVATNGGLFRQRSDKSWVTLRTPSNSFNAFWQVYEDARGTLWAGGKRTGLYRADASRTQLSIVTGLDSVFQRAQGITIGVRDLFEDSHGLLWVSTSLGLAVRDSRTGTFHIPNLLGRDQNTALNVVREDPEGRIWVGTDEGIYVGTRDAHELLPSSWRFVNTKSQGQNFIWTFSTTSLDPSALYFGTIGAGVCRIARNWAEVQGEPDIQCVGPEESVPGTVYGILPEPSGILWLTTGNGLVRFHPATKESVLFTEVDGLPSRAFDLMAYHRAANGDFFAGGSWGFVRFRPEQIQASAPVFTPLITRVLVRGTLREGMLEPGSPLRLNHDEGFLTLAFSAMDYDSPRDTRYRFRLSGVEAEWRSTTGLHPEVTYANLLPGRYTFEVQAASRTGTWGPSTLLHIEVEPAWWQYRWLQALLSLLLLSGTGSITYRTLRVRRLRREERRAVSLRLAAEREKERLRLARELHDGPLQRLYHVGYTLDALAAEHPEGEVGLLDARSGVTDVARDLRNVLTSLRPAAIGTLGLAAALKSLGARLENQHGIEVQLDLKTSGRNLSEYVQQSVYRIAQEATQNAIRHAQATRIRMGLEEVGDEFTLFVYDNGKGFTVPEHLEDLARKNHFGIVGAAERAAIIGAELKVESSVGSGTRVTLYFRADGSPSVL